MRLRSAQLVNHHNSSPVADPTVFYLEFDVGGAWLAPAKKVLQR